MRQHETHRPDDVGRRRPQRLAFDQRFAHQAELVIFEIAQPAMDEFGRGRGRPGGQIVHLGKHDGISAPGRIARDAGAVDAAADDENVDRFFRHYILPRPSPRAARR